MPRKNLDSEDGFEVPDDAKRREARARRQKAKREKVSKRKRFGPLMIASAKTCGLEVMPPVEPWHWTVPPWEDETFGDNYALKSETLSVDGHKEICDPMRSRNQQPGSYKTESMNGRS